MIRFIKGSLVVAICHMFMGCANSDRYIDTFAKPNINPFAKQNYDSESTVDSNVFMIRPFNNDAEQITFSRNLHQIMRDFHLTVVSSFDNILEPSAELSSITSADVQSKKSEDDIKVVGSLKQSTSEASLINVYKNEKYIIETMSIKDSDGTVKFIRISDNKVMGTFSISPYMFKMRPQVYAALVKMRLLKGIRYY